MSNFSAIGVVVIGRNEGDRLKQCLLSLLSQATQIVYVDSGSTDGSLELARSLGVEVFSLDLSIPFTAAHARNRGLEKLVSLYPQVKYVQFVDGDCEILSGWLEKAQQILKEEAQAVAVAGRLIEKFPEKSLYNYLRNEDLIKYQNHVCCGRAV
jgi:glycosyltransferase involved in cell wall biosynthesis